MDVIAAVAPLALAHVRVTSPVPALLTAAGSQLRLQYGDADFAVRTQIPAIVHEAGEAAVGLRALATVLAGLDEPEVTLRIEGARLAVRTASARFALPLLDRAAIPPAAPLPPVVGAIDAGLLRATAAIVASAAARDGLPLFTGVRLKSTPDGRLTMVATDRFRAAVAEIPWRPVDGSEIDVLVPAIPWAQLNRPAAAGREVTLRASGSAVGVDWADGGIVTPALAMPFPDTQLAALLNVSPVAVLDVEAAELRVAVERVAPFADNGIQFDIGDGLVSLRASGELGEARQDVKASVSGDLVSARYQARYLLDAAKAYAGLLRIEVQQGIRPTVFVADSLRYLVVPLR